MPGVAQPFFGPGLVGRAAELAHLREAFATAVSGDPVAVLVAGEAGIGKTRLVGEFASEVLRAGARCVVGQCVEMGENGLPYAPVAGALREVVAELGADALLTLAGPGHDVLSRVLPELVTAPRAADDGDARGRLFELVTSLLERLSADRPLVLVIEDLHWADASTRDLLRFAVRALGSARVMIIATHRSDEIHRSHPLRPLLAEFDRLRRVRRIEIARLDRDEVEQLLTDILGETPRAAVVQQLYLRSEGIPFFVEELASAELHDASAPIPDSLRDLLLVRVEDLSERTQRLLRLAAVEGNRVQHGLLASVAGLDDHDLDTALREAVSANILRVDGEGYAFRHALLREALHDDLLPGEHSRHHQRYAQALEDHPELAASGSAAVRIAHHWNAAHDVTRAFRAYLTAADDAQRSYAYGDAQTMLENALELWHRVPDADAISGGDHVDLAYRASRAATDAGEYDRALALIVAAIDESDPGADPNRHAELLHVQARLLSELGRPEAVDVLSRGLELLPADQPSQVRADLLLMLASRRMMDADLEQALAAAAEAETTAGAIGDTATLSRVAKTVGTCRVVMGEVDEGFRAFDRSRRLAGSSHRLLLSYHINASDSLNLLGRYADAVEVARQGIATAAESGLGRHLGAMVHGNAAEPLFNLGHWTEADELITRALDLDPPARHLWHLLSLHAALRVWRGQVESAREALTVVSRQVARRQPGLQYSLPIARIGAEIDLALGDHHSAWQTLRAALDGPVRLPAYDLPVIGVAAAALGAVARHSGPDGAPSTLETDIAFLESLLRSSGTWPTAPVWHALVTAELAGGDGRDPVAWRAALDVMASPLAPAHLRPYAGYQLGRVLVETGDRDAATPVLRVAAEQAAALGAGLIGSWIEDLARRSRLPVHGAHAATETDDHFGLTARELEVLRLVAAGRTNRQIGESLFISAKTASVHVSNILTKLRVSGRGEAAAVAHRAGLFPDLDSRQPA